MDGEIFDPNTWEGFKIKCAGCGEIFTARTVRARWCSPACSQRAYRLRNGLNKTGATRGKRKSVRDMP